MKKNKILLIAAVACTSMFSSCSDLLDLYPEDSLSDPKFWTSVQDLELYANGFYGILPGAQGPGADDESDCYVNEKPNGSRGPLLPCLGVCVQSETLWRCALV